MENGSLQFIIALIVFIIMLVMQIKKRTPQQSDGEGSGKTWGENFPFPQSFDLDDPSKREGSRSIISDQMYQEGIPTTTTRLDKESVVFQLSVPTYMPEIESAIPSQQINKEPSQDTHFEFDIRQAIISAEIITPKFLKEEY